MDGDRQDFRHPSRESAGSPLAGALVLEFGTLLPGPMTSLILAEAGAEVVKIERPPRGDEMRGYDPKLGRDSVHFHALNRGKTSICVDLKDERSRSAVIPLLKKADIIIEQFRPGAMERLGLGYDAVKSVNPRVIYCSLTGYGQTGPKARRAGHDLNFLAESGLLDQVRDASGSPTLPPLLAADVAGGVYPAVINILLAYIQRGATGAGMHLDIAISDGLAAFHYDTLISALRLGIWPRPGEDLTNGGSPRYQIYPTSDGRHLAVAAMEDRFWENFCALIGLDEALRRKDVPHKTVISAVARIIAEKSAAEWEARCRGLGHRPIKGIHSRAAA